MFKFKRVMTYSPVEKKVRLFRLLWRPVQGDPGYSRFFSMALRPRLFQFREQEEDAGWMLTLLGIQAHYRWSSVGTFAE